MTDVNAQLKNLFARTRTDALMTSLSVLAGTIQDCYANEQEVPFELRQAHAWTCEELCARFPEADAAMQAWAENENHTGWYGHVLLETIQALREGGRA